MTLKNYTEWVLDIKRQELKSDRLEVSTTYKCSSPYDKETKKHKKVTGEYLDKITEADGFLPAARRIIKVENPETGQQTTQKIDVKSYHIDNLEGILNLEYGFYCFYRDYIKSKNVYNQKLFPI